MTTPGLSLRDYTILKSGRAVCPRCFGEDEQFDPQYPVDICDGHLLDRGGKVYLRRFCRRRHGEVWSLYEESAELWRYGASQTPPVELRHGDKLTGLGKRGKIAG